MLAGISRSCLDGRLIADGHDPMAISLDPETGHMDGLANIGLVVAGHYHGISEIKNLCRNERGRRGTMAGLLLQIESGNTVGFAEGMVVGRAEHDKFIGDVRGPGGGVMVGDASLESLPGSDDGLLGFI